jgi:hypothetical protein
MLEIQIGKGETHMSKLVQAPHAYKRRNGKLALLVSHDGRRRILRNLMVIADGDELIFYQCDDGGHTKLGEDTPDDIMDMDWRSK